MAQQNVFKGDNLHNPRLNKTGVVLDASNKEAVKVRTVSGDDYWKLSDCENLDLEAVS
jgi:hypothetical protein